VIAARVRTLCSALGTTSLMNLRKPTAGRMGIV
jgi:hypothetical protein